MGAPSFQINAKDWVKPGDPAKVLLVVDKDKAGRVIGTYLATVQIPPGPIGEAAPSGFIHIIELPVLYNSDESLSAGVCDFGEPGKDFSFVIHDPGPDDDLMTLQAEYDRACSEEDAAKARRDVAGVRKARAEKAKLEEYALDLYNVILTRYGNPYHLGSGGGK